VRSHQSLPVGAGRVELDLSLARHEVTLVEISPVIDGTPPWWESLRSWTTNEAVSGVGPLGRVGPMVTLGGSASSR
jgi:xylan 1,4-beta-xylosidase